MHVISEQLPAPLSVTELRTLPALSIRQPWATSILNGKDVENRAWATRFRGRFLIHASKTLDPETIEAWRLFVSDLPEGAIAWAKVQKIGQLPLGGIIGVAELVDCVQAHSSPWFTGEYGFVLRNVAAVPFIPCRGMPGFFKPQFCQRK